MLKYPVVLAVVVVFALAAWWGFMPGPEDAVIETPEHVEETTSQWQWVFDPAGEDAETGAPRTNVVLRNGDTSYAVGTFPGSCFDIVQSDWKLLTDEGEIAGAICWFAGGGSEIGVFSDNGRAVVRIGDVDEGTAEEPGVRGNWRDIFTIAFGFIPQIITGATTTIGFDEAFWMTGEAGEDAAIAAGMCTEATRSECLPNGFYIESGEKIVTTLPLAPTVAIYMVTWHMEERGVQREYIRLADFSNLINDAGAQWNKLPYNITLKDNQVIMIEEVYVP